MALDAFPRRRLIHQHRFVGDQLRVLVTGGAADVLVGALQRKLRAARMIE